MLTTLEDTYSLVSSHLQRVRDLTEQAANGTYGSDSLKAIQSEITARLEEIDRIAANCEFNGLNMMDGSMKNLEMLTLYSVKILMKLRKNVQDMTVLLLQATSQTCWIKLMK